MTRRGPSLTDLVPVMVVRVVRMVRVVRVVKVAQVRGDVHSQLLVRPGLHLCWLVKVRFHTFLESIRLLTLSLSLSLCTQWCSWCSLQGGGTPTGWGLLGWSYCMLRATPSPSPHTKSRYVSQYLLSHLLAKVSDLVW